jgi:hypothetical protein
MPRLTTRAILLALLSGALLMLSCTVAGSLSERLALPSDIAAARSRWAAAAITHYRLTTLSGNPCRLDVEVRDEHVVRVFREDSCSHSARTVSRLFDVVERAVSPLYTCAPPSCACRHVVTVYAIYDEQLGYPHKVAVRVERETNWGERPFWRYLLAARRLPDCEWASNADIVNVLAMTPLH